MPDSREGRDKQARDSDTRQRERAMLEELERWSETEPTVYEEDLDAVEADLEGLEFPLTGEEVVERVGDQRVETGDGSYAVADLIPETEAVRFETPRVVRVRIKRATVAAAMKRIYEAVETLPNAELRGSQREAYERTLRELQGIDAVDEDEGIEVVADWIVEQIRDREKLPGSRQVRKRGAKFARAQGHEVRNDEWLGV